MVKVCYDYISHTEKRSRSVHKRLLYVNVSHLTRVLRSNFDAELENHDYSATRPYFIFKKIIINSGSGQNRQGQFDLDLFDLTLN